MPRRPADEPPTPALEGRLAPGRRLAPEGRREGLPASVPLLAALGLVVLCVCTLPAVHAQRQLERDHARLGRETRAAEERVERLQRELRTGTEQRYLRAKATRELLHHGSDYIRERDRKLGQDQTSGGR